jgi:hypothetical protein
MKSRRKIMRAKVRAPSFIYVGKLMKDGPVTQELWPLTTDETPRELLDPQIAMMDDQEKSMKVAKTKKEIEMELACRIQEENNKQVMEAHGNVIPCQVFVPNLIDIITDPFERFRDFKLARAR